MLYNSAARTRTGNTMSHTGPGAASGGPHASPPGTVAHEGAGQDQVGRNQSGRDTAVWDQRQYGTPRDPRETETIAGLGSQWAAPSALAAPAGAAPTAADSIGGASNGGASNGGGRPGDTARQHAQGSLTGEGPAGDDAGGGGLWGAFTSFFGSLTRRQWLTYSGIAAGFFLVVVAGITVFELTIGKPVGTAVWGGHSSGTSLGDTFSGQRSPHQKPDAPVEHVVRDADRIHPGQPDALRGDVVGGADPEHLCRAVFTLDAAVQHADHGQRRRGQVRDHWHTSPLSHQAGPALRPWPHGPLYRSLGSAGGPPVRHRDQPAGGRHPAARLLTTNGLPGGRGTSRGLLGGMGRVKSWRHDEANLRDRREWPGLPGHRTGTAVDGYRVVATTGSCPPRTWGSGRCWPT